MDISQITAGLQDVLAPLKNENPQWSISFDIKVFAGRPGYLSMYLFKGGEVVWSNGVMDYSSFPKIVERACKFIAQIDDNERAETERLASVLGIPLAVE